MSVTQDPEDFQEDDETVSVGELFTMPFCLAFLAFGMILFISVIAIEIHVGVGVSRGELNTTAVNGYLNATCDAENLCLEGVCLSGLCRPETSSDTLMANLHPIPGCGLACETTSDCQTCPRGRCYEHKCISTRGTSHTLSDDYTDSNTTTVLSPLATDDTGLPNEVAKREPRQCKTSADCSPLLCIGGICIGRDTEEAKVDAAGLGSHQADAYTKQRCANANGLGRCIANRMPPAEEITGVEIRIVQDDDID